MLFQIWDLITENYSNTPRILTISKKGVPTISPGDCPVLGLLHHQERQGHINVTNHLEVDRHSQTALNPGFRKGLENKGSTVSFKFGLNALDLRCCVSDVVMIALLRRIRFHICM